MIFNPQKYRAEFAYRLAAWAAIQDVDVISFHYYGHPPVFSDLPTRYTMNPLEYMTSGYTWAGVNMRTDEVLMSSIRLAGEIFKHGYLAPAKNPTIATLGCKTMFDFDGMHGGEFGNRSRLTAFERGFRWSFDPKRDGDSIRGPLVSPRGQEKVVRPTDQIAYRWDEGKMVIDDSRAKALIGFDVANWKFDEGVELKDIAIQNPPGMPYVIEGERYAAIGITSQDGKPLANSAKVLVSAVSTSFNSGLEIDRQKMIENTGYASGLASAITNPGGLPVLTARVAVTIRAPWLKGRHYRMIDYNNNVIADEAIEGMELVIPATLPVYLTEIYTPGATRSAGSLPPPN